MTVIAAVLSPQYALVLSDTRTTLIGPAQVRLPPAAPVRVHVGAEPVAEWPEVLDLAPGDRLTIDGYVPGLDKVKFVPDMSEAFAFAGTRSVIDGFLGLDGIRAGMEADRVIAQHFAALASFDTLLDLPTGSYPSHAGMHVYFAKERFYAATFGASPVALTRKYARSRPAELVHAAIGSGAEHLERLLSESPEWARLRSDPGIARMPDVIRVVGAALAKTCEVVHDVNNVISCWARRSDGPAFQDRGIFEHDARPLPPIEAAENP
jgi:hypothetical protein